MKVAALVLFVLFFVSLTGYADEIGNTCTLGRSLRIFDEFAPSFIVNYKGPHKENLYTELEAKGDSFTLPVGTQILVGNRHSSYPMFIWVDVIGTIDNTAMGFVRSGFVYANEIACKH